MHIVIVTGASKGIGAALVEEWKKKDDTIVIGVARTSVHTPDRMIAGDVTAKETREQFQELLKEYETRATAFTLINNAGVVEPIGMFGMIDSEAIERAIQINVTAPMEWTNTFIHALRDFKGKKRVMNISSGAGRKTYDGWGVYGTTKAAIDHFSWIVFEEQKRAAYPVDIVAIAPGIIDTNMQTVIRQADEEAFPPLQRFIDYKKEEVLQTPEETAAALVRYIMSDEMSKTPKADIRDFL